ncbi:MAG: thioredoxin domain-containing protein [Candidatus Berkelbacteria bacterium]|nr:MAG: thioredoxin domain-containing protein [Candidatus Berkelbacteria bacterium]QQG51950.1 MAG: thioredoxin domain-containing protein [Candidatus Berkelbacteria bacterium]
MSSDMKFVGAIVVVAVLAIVGFVIFGKNAKTSDPAAQVEAAALTDAGQQVRPDSYKKGIENGKVIVVEWGDYQCPACQAADTEVTQIVSDFADRITFVFRHFPLPNHKFSQLTATAVEAAGAQGKYWEMHAKLYGNQEEWSTASTSKAVELFVGYAKDLGIDTEKFRADLVGRVYNDKIARDLADAAAIGVSKTPTFFVNSVEVGLDGLRTAIEEGLK